jgi:hypothetical protein
VEKLKIFQLFYHRSSSLDLDKYEGRAVELTGNFLLNYTEVRLKSGLFAIKQNNPVNDYLKYVTNALVVNEL